MEEHDCGPGMYVTLNAAMMHCHRVEDCTGIHAHTCGDTCPGWKVILKDIDDTGLFPCNFRYEKCESSCSCNIGELRHIVDGEFNGCVSSCHDRPSLGVKCEKESVSGCNECRCRDISNECFCFFCFLFLF